MSFEPDAAKIDQYTMTKCQSNPAGILFVL